MSFHLYDVTELYSNADGTIQFIELAVGPNNGEDQWHDQTITVTQGGTVHSITFNNTTTTDAVITNGDLPSGTTQNTTVLLATSGFAAATGITPNFIIPDNFLFTDGGLVNYAGNTDRVTYNSLPTDGALSISTAGVRSGGAITIDSSQTIQLNSPKNFAGDNTDPVPSASLVAGATAGDNNLTGGAGNDVVAGLAGNDTLSGGAGIDTLMGGIGNDVLLVDNAADYVFEKTGEGSDTVLASINNYTLPANADGLVLDLSGGIITGTGNALANYMRGNAENNVLNGLDGNDTLEGGLGLVSDGNDTLDGGNGNDSVAGGTGDDSLLGGAGNDTLSGGDGNDTLFDGDGNNSLNADAGNDNILGGIGNDTISGGDGNDSMLGGAGNDTLFGNAGNDSIRGAAGDDSVLAGFGNDVVRTGDGNDWVNGGPDNDVLYSALGNDELRGGLGNDENRGGFGTDTLFGGEGNDSLFGGPGNDVLSGGQHDDWLAGLVDNDTLTGAGGADRFWFNSKVTADADTITDFSLTDDTILLDPTVFTQLAGNINAAPDAEFFVSGAGMTEGSEADDYIVYNTTTGDLYFDADGFGGNASQLVATVSGAPALTLGDFFIAPL